MSEVLTWPLLVATLALATALPLSEIIQASFWAGVIMVNLLLGGLVRSTYKWGFFVFAVAALGLTWYFFYGAIIPGARVLGSDYSGLQIGNTVYLGVLLLLYIIAWGVCEGGNVISVTAEFIWYGILDLLTKPFFLVAYLILLTRVDLTKLHLQSAKYTNTAPDNVVLSLANSDTHSAPRSSHDTVVQEKVRPKFSFSRKGRYDATDGTTQHVTTQTTTTAPPGAYNQAPPGAYAQAPPGAYTQAPPGTYTESIQGTFIPAPPGTYAQAPAGTHRQAPAGTHNQASSRSYSQAPTGTHSPPPAGSHHQAPADTYTQAPSGSYAQAPPGSYTQAPPGSYTQAPAGTYGQPSTSHAENDVAHPDEARVSTATETAVYHTPAGQQI